jgi:ketosteroid isomerase-like protein
MTAIAPHPYRTALETRDAEALREALHPDVAFHTPAFGEPVRGRDRVLALFAVLATVFEDPVITDELAGEGTHAIAFRLHVEGHPIEGVDHLQLDEDGRVRSVTVSMRPLASLQVLAARMAETHAKLVAD